MKMRKMYVLLLTAAIAALLAGCGSKGTAAAPASSEGKSGTAVSREASEKKKRVCFVSRASADTFAAWLTSEMKKEAKNYNDIELTCVSGEGDDNKENGLLEDCITKKYDLVIVQSNNNSAQAPYVEKLVEANIPVITTNPTTHQSDLDGSNDNSVMKGTGTVDADPVMQAKAGADRAVTEIPPNANVVVLKGPSGNYHADKRREAWTRYFFDKRPDVKILYEDYANWNSDEALTLMESWVQSGTHIDAVISMNDNMAAGAIEAVRDNRDYVSAEGKPSFLAYGVDGTAQGCLLVREGLLTCTVLQSAADLAKKNMEYAGKIVNGQMAVTEVNDFVDAPGINKDNVDQYIRMYIDNGEITDPGSVK